MLLQRDFIYAQDTHQWPDLRIGCLLRPALQNVRHGGLIQPFLFCHFLAAGAQTTLVDMQLEAARLTPMAAYAGQLLGERSPALLTVKAPTGKVHKGPPAYEVQVTHTTVFVLVPLGRGSSAPWTEGYLVTMLTVEMNDTNLALLFQGIAEYTELGQIQELAESCFCNALDSLAGQTFDRAACVSDRLDGRGQQWYT
jgi:hypothetical protein